MFQIIFLVFALQTGQVKPFVFNGDYTDKASCDIAVEQRAAEGQLALDTMYGKDMFRIEAAHCIPKSDGDPT